MTNIYFKNNKCPICNQKMKVVQENYKICYNGCYKVYPGPDYSTLTVEIFGNHKSVNILGFSDIIQDLVDWISKNISFWKENDRYLMEILSKKNE